MKDPTERLVEKQGVQKALKEALDQMRTQSNAPNNWQADMFRRAVEAAIAGRYSEANQAASLVNQTDVSPTPWPGSHVPATGKSATSVEDLEKWLEDLEAARVQSHPAF